MRFVRLLYSTVSGVYNRRDSLLYYGFVVIIIIKFNYRYWSHWRLSLTATEQLITEWAWNLQKWPWPSAAILTCEFARDFSPIYTATKQKADNLQWFSSYCPDIDTHTSTKCIIMDHARTWNSLPADLRTPEYDSVLLQASSQGPPVSAVVHAAADWWLSTVCPAPLWLFSELAPFTNTQTYLLT